MCNEVSTTTKPQDYEQESKRDPETRGSYRKIRGTAVITAENKVTFTPFAEGEPQRADVRTCGRSTAYTTQGEKRRSMVVHLMADADSPDPYGDMAADFCRLVPAEPDRRMQRGRKLADNGITTVTANGHRRTLEIRMQVDLRQTPDYERLFLREIQEVLKCFAYNQTYLAQLVRAARKSGKSSPEEKK